MFSLCCEICQENPPPKKKSLSVVFGAWAIWTFAPFPPTDNCNGPLASTLPQSSFQSSSQSSASYAAYNAKLNRRDGECRRRLTRTVLWVHVVCFVLFFLGKMWSIRCEKFWVFFPPKETSRILVLASDPSGQLASEKHCYKKAAAVVVVVFNFRKDVVWMKIWLRDR